MSTLKKLAKLVVPRAVRPSQFLGPHIRSIAQGKVLEGPYAGMSYLPHSYFNLYYPKLLGTYEKEIHPALEWICGQKPEVLIDVGAAEGYYAVGLARRLPETKVIAFEAVESEQQRLRELCAMNGVSHQVDIRGKCDVESLSSAMAMSESPVVVCDVEGYEDVLLHPNKLQNCERATFLVEVHPFDKPRLIEELIERFSPTHDCKRIDPQPRHDQEFPVPNSLSRILPKIFSTGPMHEFRAPGLCWLFARPKS